MQLTGRLFLLTTLLVGFTVDACATLPPAKPIANFQDIAGKWEGTSAWVEFKADGTYTWFIGRNSGTGTMRIEGGDVYWASSSGRRGKMTLHEGEGRRVLKSVAYETGFTVELKPAK